MKPRAAWVRTPALERWCNHAATGALAITGVALAVMMALPEPDDPFAVVRHPLQPAMLAGHVLAAPLGVLGIGLLLRHHVLARLLDAAFRRSRRSGWTLVLTATPMVISGYLLQVTTSEGWREAWLVTHLVTGGAWCVGWIAHLGSARGWWRRSTRHP